MYKKVKGVTLIEIMLVVVILGILVAIVYPSYHKQVLKSYRTEATKTLLKLANYQEQYLADSGYYSGDLVLLGLAASLQSESGRFRFSVRLMSDNREYVLTATAQGPQTQDTECPVFTLNQAGQRNAGRADVSCWL